jgi:hypothetical protein
VDKGAPVSDEERETRYLAVDAAEFDKLINETQALLADFPQDKQYLLTRWLSLRLAMTVIAATKGSTMDSQAQITLLLKSIESLQSMTERTETEHVDWYGPDGVKRHPDWCRECRVDKLMHSVKLALAELERHIDGPETPPALANVCRRVARLLTSYKGWHAPVQWENAGLREVRALVEQYLKLDTVDDRYPWVSTIEGLRVLLGDVRAMHKTIERRGRWLAEARERLNAGAEQPVTNRSLDGTGVMLERGAVLSVDNGGITELYTITDVQPVAGSLVGATTVSLQRVD